MTSMKQASAALAICLAASLAGVAPNSPRAQARYDVGDRVAAPIGAQFFEAVVVQVNPSPPSYRVHPLGFTSTADFTANPQMLRPLGSVKVEPRGGIADDPYLKGAR
jgi:hypothetical protein